MNLHLFSSVDELFSPIFNIGVKISQLLQKKSRVDNYNYRYIKYNIIIVSNKK